MKTIIFIFAFLFSFQSFAKWTNIVSSVDGVEFFVDLDTIKKNNGLVYYWDLMNYPKPTKFGDLSNKRFFELQCDVPLKLRQLSATYYTGAMGKGKISTVSNRRNDWIYPGPGSSQEAVANFVCLYSKEK